MISRNNVVRRESKEGLQLQYEKYTGTSEALLRDMLDNAVDITVIIDNKGNYVYISPAILDVTGFSSEDLVTKPFKDWIHPEDVDNVMAAYRKTYMFGKHRKLEYRYRKKDGNYIWFENRGQLIYENGRVKGLISFARDINERKVAEEALRESETLFRAIFNNAAVGIALLNEDGEIETINETFCAFLGYRQEDIIGRSILLVIDEEEKGTGSLVHNAFHKSKKGSYVVEKRFRCVDGETVWGRLNISLIKDIQGRCPYLVIVCEDITSLKVKENELQAVQSIYTATLGALEEVSVSSACERDEMRTLADLGICLQSAGYEEVVAGYEVVCDLLGALGVYYGYDESTGSLPLVGLIGLAETEQICTSHILSFKLGEERGLIGKAAETRECIYVPDVLAEPNWITADADMVIRSSYIMPIYYGEKLFGVLSVVSQQVDGFSQEKRAFADSIASFISAAMENTRLFFEIKQAYEELNTTQQQLLQAQKMEAIGQLAGGMAHDINNQLTIIQACVDLCCPQVEGEYLNNIFNKIRTAAERSANLTRQLMIFGRKQPQFKINVDLNQNIRQLQEMLGRLIRNNVEIKYDLAPDLQVINADSTNIDQVIVNLALNGQDAMPDGGQLIIKTRNQRIDSFDELPEDCYIGSYSIGSYICLSVTDTGKGFDEQIKNRLFEPFFTTKDTYNYTGLGLPVVYGIVKSHDGWINVKSQPDNGSIFEIFLPALD